MAAVAELGSLGRSARMNRKRPLVWGMIGGCLFGCAMLLLGISLDDAWRAGDHVNMSPVLVIWAVLHWPTRALLDHSHAFYQAIAIVVGYWTIIGVVAGLLVSLFRTWRAKRRRTYAA